MTRKKKVIVRKGTGKNPNVSKKSKISAVKLSFNTNLNPLKKNYSLTEKLIGFIELGRPVEWSKPLFNMTLALFIAFYVYQANVSLGVLFLGFFCVAFLWSGLYALNDYTDWRIDLIHKVKKLRAIPSGRVTPKQGLIYSLILIVFSFFLASMINNLLVLCLFAMLLNQLLYTTKPFRLKSVKGLDLVSGSMINPFFRYLSGLVLFVPLSVLLTTPFPILPIIIVIGIQFSGYSLYRLFSKEHDLKIKMQSSVALLSEKTIKLLSYSSIALSIGSYFGLFVNYFLFKEQALGFLPPQYLLAVLVVVLFLPNLINGMIHPTKADMKKDYSTLYASLISFVIANLIIFVLIK